MVQEENCLESEDMVKAEMGEEIQNTDDGESRAVGMRFKELVSVLHLSVSSHVHKRVRAGMAT